MTGALSGSGSFLTPARLLLIGTVLLAVLLWPLGPGARVVLVALFLLLAPGFLIERVLRPQLHAAPLSRPLLWVGLSLVSVPLIYLWCSSIGLPLRQPILAAAATACAFACLLVGWREGGTGAWPGRAALGWATAYGLLFGTALGLRFFEIRELALPSWVDSVHHTLLVRVAAERGLAPVSLRPFLPVDDLPYHWGYHVWTAAVAQLAGVAPVDAVLWSGQLLNALHVFTLAALALFLWRHPLAGLAAGLVVGMLSIYPAYYVSWGRYTQLMGLLLIPPLMLAWQALLRQPGWRQAALLTLLSAGLSLIHIRVLLFGLAYLAVALLVYALSATWVDLRRRLLVGGAAGLAALALTAPWMGLLLRQRLVPAVEAPDQLLGGGSYNALNTALLWTEGNQLLALLSALALLAALWLLGRRSGQALNLLLWVAAILVMANPWLLAYVVPAGGALLMLEALMRRRWLLAGAAGLLLLLHPALLQLPFFWLITNEVVIISLFVPISLLIGGGTASLVRRLVAGPFARQPALLYVGCSLLLAIGAGWGYRHMHPLVLQDSLVLATAADRAAIEWLAEHTPRDARFLTNARPWLPAADMGSDAGWWILPLTGRWTSTPPVLFTYANPEYSTAVRATTRTVVEYRPGAEQTLHELIEREAITHIFIGSRGGPLQPELFSDSDHFELIYEHQGVSIYRVR